MAEEYSMKSMNATETRVPADMEPKHTGYDGDEAVLAYFGKEQRLKRNFGLISIIGLTSTLMITWEGLLTAFQGGLTNGGPAGLVYGYIWTWFGTILQCLVMAEMASMIPLSGGQYNWVAILCPPWCSKFFSYVTGWVTFIAWQAVLASAAFLAGTMIQGLLILNYPDYVYAAWQGTLLFYAIIALALFVNTVLARLLPAIESGILVIHIVGFFAILIPLVYLAPHGTPSDVFTLFNNGGGWQTSGLSFFVGETTCMFAFIGIDAAAHMAEEIKNATTVIPTSMITSVILNGTLGFAMLIAILFCIGDLDNALTTPTGFPFIEIFTQATGSTAGGSAMASVIIAAMIFAGIGLVATTSRMTWAFAREKGLPGHSILGRVHAKTALPLWSIALTILISLLLALINIGSTTAFNALTGLVVAAFYSSFLCAAVALLAKRMTHSMDAIRFGPFNLGRAGIPIIIGSIIYSVIGIFFSFFPPAPNPTPQSMNWCVAVFGGVLVFSGFYYVIWARKVYTGPVVEIRVDSQDGFSRPHSINKITKD